jgi:hypothetical protein
MAGQRIYNTLVSTSGRSPIIVTASMSVDTSKASGGTTNLIGKSLVYSNSNGVVTVTLPEKYGKVEFIHVTLVDPGKTGNQAVITTDYTYNPTPGVPPTFQFSILSPAQAAVTTGTFKCYIMFYVVQSM